MLEDASLLEQTGVFGLVMEKIPAHLATQVSRKLSIPTIGIGAGNGTDGQVLVSHDLFGITKEFNPRFLRRYSNLFSLMKEAVEHYIKDVKSSDFPNEKEQY